MSRAGSPASKSRNTPSPSWSWASPSRTLTHYVEQYRGVTVEQKVKLGGAERDGYVTIDGITGATITAMVMNATVMKSVQKVAVTRGIPRRPMCRQRQPVPGRAAHRKQRGRSASVEPPPAWWLGESSEPFWVSVWRDRALADCGTDDRARRAHPILLFQDWLTRRPGLLQGRAYRFPAVYAVLYRLVHPRAAVDHPCADLYQCHPAPVQLGVVPGRSADLHPLGVRGADPAVVGAGCVLRLAVSLRRLAGTACISWPSG